MIEGDDDLRVGNAHTRGNLRNKETNWEVKCQLESWSYCCPGRGAREGGQVEGRMWFDSIKDWGDLPTSVKCNERAGSSFIPRTCNLWNVLPSSCFP